MPVSLRLRLNKSISSFSYGFAAHWRDERVKIWIASHSTFFPSRSDLSTPPAIDMCAPSSGRRNFEFSVFNFEFNSKLNIQNSTLFREVAFFHERQRDAAGAQEPVVEGAEVEA